MKIADGTDNDITEAEVVRNGPDMSRARKPQDHKAKKKTAAQREAEGVETADVEWREHTFTVAATPEDWPVETTLAFEEGKAASGVRGLLGPEQWAELLKSKPRNRDLANLFETLAEELGLGE